MATTLKTLDYTTMTLDDAKSVIDSLATAEEKIAIEVNRKFFYGDHWQNGDGWVGPRPRDKDKDKDAALTLIKTAFVSKNVVKTVVQRHTGGVIGREPSWTLVRRVPIPEPTTPNAEAAEQLQVDEINNLLTTWWDTRGAQAFIQKVVDVMLYAKRGVMRLHVPAGQVSGTADAAATTVVVSVSDPAEAILLVWPDAPAPEASAVYVDRDTKKSLGILLEEIAGKQQIELVYLDASAVAAAGTTPMTTIRSLSSDKEAAAGAPVLLDLGGRLTMYEIAKDLLITPQVVQAQRALNLALSMLPRNVVTGGFLERIFTNAQLPGKLVEQADGSEVFVEDDDMEFGAGKSNFLTGEETIDEATGKTVLATPGIHEREPVPVTSSVDAKNAHYQDILDEVDQLHVLQANDANTSGISREQARADFEESLRKTQTLVHGLGRWMLETVLAWTEALVASPGKWTSIYRVEFRTHIDTGPLSADEQRVNNENVTSGTMSRETAMERAQITDPDAELARIASQPDAQLAIIERQAQVIERLVNVGLLTADAARVAGVDEDVIARFGTSPGIVTDTTSTTQ